MDDMVSGMVGSKVAEQVELVDSIHRVAGSLANNWGNRLEHRSERLVGSLVYFQQHTKMEQKQWPRSEMEVKVQCDHHLEKDDDGHVLNKNKDR